jgi:His-Xaa-Ser system radical SAM maturase HxsB
VPAPTVSHPSQFRSSSDGYRLLPFNFMRVDGRVFIANDAGEHVLLSNTGFTELVEHRLDVTSPLYEALKARHFLFDGEDDIPLRLLGVKLRTKKGFLAGFTGLHIFVVTLRCDHSCAYCQVSRVSQDRVRYDMTREMADQALDLVFRSPGRALTIEFQGGEPLLNFPLIRHVVEEAERRNMDTHKDLQFVVATNLSLIDDVMLAFFRDRNVHISTSLDGPAFIHNANRPRPERDSYERTIAGITRAREALGPQSVSALMTTTKLSLEHPIEVVDEYVRRNFSYIFLRPLSPYGFAARSSAKTGYEVDRFIQFYKTALDRIIAMNRDGHFLVEMYAKIILTKILTPFVTGYVDLRSPTGAGIGVVVYNYDGDVYASDEARMLAQMGDKRFRLGSLATDDYQTIFGGPALRRLVESSCVESLPGCSACAYGPFCGSDPIENFTSQGDIIGHHPTSAFCKRNMAIIGHLLGLLHSDDPFIEELFWSWVHTAPAAELLAQLPD